VLLLAAAALLHAWLRLARAWGPVDGRLVRAGGLIFAITLLFGAPEELRVFVPTFACVLLAGLTTHDG
jgi:hypothetical protein